jgi:hypothetical protein
MWGASCLVALLLTPYWAYWFFNSPMMDLSHELSAVNPPDRSQSRFHYLRNVVISRRKSSVRYLHALLDRCAW